MQSYHTQLTVPANGVLILEKVPFFEGEEVVVTIEAKEHSKLTARKFPYRGKPFSFRDPFAPVFDEKTATRNDD